MRWFHFPVVFLLVGQGWPAAKLPTFKGNVVKVAREPEPLVDTLTRIRLAEALSALSCDTSLSTPSAPSDQTSCAPHVATSARDHTTTTCSSPEGEGFPPSLDETVNCCLGDRRVISVLGSHRAPFVNTQLLPLYPGRMAGSA